MGKIFGISDLPVSTIMTPFEQPKILSRKYQNVRNLDLPKNNSDILVSRYLYNGKNKSFIAMRNGIGRLMKSFSKKEV